MNKRRYFYSIPIILLLIVAVAGLFATDYLGNNARQEIIRENRASALTMSIYVSGHLSDFIGAVKALAGSPWIAPALLSKGAQDIENANSALDRYNQALNASVSYLMDANGMTVASSNRKDPDSFVGKSYRFRPYFQEAAKGQPGRYFALGITSGNKGFYASYPVQNRIGKVFGVVAIKKDLDQMETFFSKHPFCFLINPDGIIFLSSTPSMVLKSLWPLDKTAQAKLIASRQFGNKLFDAVMKKEIADGTEVTLEGNDYFVSRKVINNDGWSIVLFTPTDRIRIYRLIGILSTISVCFLIIIFSGFIYATDRSKEIIRQSEKRFSRLANSTWEGIIIQREGMILDANESISKMFGYNAEEITGHSVLDFLAPESIEPALQKLKESIDAPQLYLEAKGLRKDKTVFPIEVLGRSIRYKNLDARVLAIRDITERIEHLEDIRMKSMLLDSATDSIFVMDLEGNFLYVNESAYKSRGYSRDELMAINLKELDDPTYVKAIHFRFKEIIEKGTALFESAHVRKDGSVMPVEIYSRPIEMNGQIFLLSVIRDITERKLAEEKIKASLLEKETMLKEIHHRVKNNLQVISSLLNLQSGYVQDEKSREMFQESQDRVKVMANIHTMLYQSADLSRVDFGGFIRDLTGRLQQSYGTAESHIEIHADIADVSLTIETSIPCGLILNELVSNALKHAFPEGKGGEVHISMKAEGDQFTLTVRDNGIGFPAVVDFQNTQSLGLELVNLLVGQMNGTIDLTVEGGTTFTITFPAVSKGG